MVLQFSPIVVQRVAAESLATGAFRQAQSLSQVQEKDRACNYANIIPASEPI